MNKDLTYLCETNEVNYERSYMNIPQQNEKLKEKISTY